MRQTGCSTGRGGNDVMFGRVEFQVVDAIDHGSGIGGCLSSSLDLEGSAANYFQCSGVQMSAQAGLAAFRGDGRIQEVAGAIHNHFHTFVQPIDIFGVSSRSEYLYRNAIDFQNGFIFVQDLDFSFSSHYTMQKLMN